MVTTAKAAAVCEKPWSLRSGGCTALYLPSDDTIARAARTYASQQLQVLGLPANYTDDIVLMVSELATNALVHGAPRSPNGQLLPCRSPELWIYRRTNSQGPAELVIKIFDTLRLWRPSNSSIAAEGLPESGRGLDVINNLTQGRWGHHPTRSRLGQPASPGKATWFAMPLPRQAHPPSWQIDEAHATADLHTLLTQRGVERLIHRTYRGASMLSVRAALTVWCEDGIFRWRTPAGHTARMAVCDITEVCEQVVQLHEAMNVNTHAGTP